MKLLRQTELEIQLGDKNKVWLLLALFPLSLAIAAFFTGPPGAQRWLGVGSGAVMAAGFAAIGLWREELTLDLLHHTFSRSTGFWPFVETTTGSFNEFRGVMLRTAVKRSDDNYPERQEWYLDLIISPDKKPPVLGTFQDEAKAFQELERYATKLKLPAIDHTGGHESITLPEDLEKRTGTVGPASGVVGRREAATIPGNAPADASQPPLFRPVPWPNRIQVTGSGALKAIFVPPQKFDEGARNRVLGRSLVLSLGLVLLFSAPFTTPRFSPTTLWPDFMPMAISAGTVFLGLTLLISSLAALWNLSQAYTRRTTIEDLGNSLRIVEESWSRAPRTAVAKKSEIRAVALKPVLLPRGVRVRTSFNAGGVGFGAGNKNEGPGMDLEIRTGSAVHHLGDLCNLSELNWLSEAVTAMAQNRPLGK